MGPLKTVGKSRNHLLGLDTCEQTNLLLGSQTCQHSTGLPVRSDPPQILIRREEAHDPTWHHVTDIGENTTSLIHL